MTRMTGPDCVVMCNLINTHTHIHTHTQKHTRKPRKSCRRDQALSFRTRHHLRKQSVALAGARQLHPQGTVPVHAHRTEGVTVFKGREGANGVGGGIGDGNGAGTGTGT